MKKYSKKELINICSEYLEVMRKLFRTVSWSGFSFMGGELFKLSARRRQLHDRLCRIFDITEDELLEISYHMFEDWNAEKLYHSLKTMKDNQ